MSKQRQNKSWLFDEYNYQESDIATFKTDYDLDFLSEPMIETLHNEIQLKKLKGGE